MMGIEKQLSLHPCVYHCVGPTLPCVQHPSLALADDDGECECAASCLLYLLNIVVTGKIFTFEAWQLRRGLIQNQNFVHIL